LEFELKVDDRDVLVKKGGFVVSWVGLINVINCYIDGWEHGHVSTFCQSVISSYKFYGNLKSPIK